MKFTEYLDILTQQNGSDLYLSTDAKPTIRVDNQLIAIEETPCPPGFIKEMAYGIMNAEQIASFEQAPEMNLSFKTENARFRVNIFKQRGDLAMVVRNIKLIMPKMEELGLPAETLQKVIMSKRGLVLFVGATSSGKSTSLAALINHRNENDSCHIITIEDPMEFVHQHKKSIVEQREVGFDTRSYEEALENTLRQAPHVILIGEIRTRKTMEHAVTFAETGHLCLSTLHANNSNQAISRILSFFPEDQHTRILLELSLNMRAIISQRLIPCIQGGVVPAVEILLDSPLAKELIKRGELRELKEVMRKSELMGMQTFDSSLYKLYKAGKITFEDALANADSANDLRLRIEIEESAYTAANGENVENSEAAGTEENTAASNAEPPKPRSTTGLVLEKEKGKGDDTGFVRRN